jgi:hypothetical protein
LSCSAGCSNAGQYDDQIALNLSGYATTKTVNLHSCLHH